MKLKLLACVTAITILAVLALPTHSGQPVSTQRQRQPV